MVIGNLYLFKIISNKVVVLTFAYCAPPVLMLLDLFGWDTEQLATHFDGKAFLAN